MGAQSAQPVVWQASSSVCVKTERAFMGAMIMIVAWQFKQCEQDKIDVCGVVRK